MELSRYYPAEPDAGRDVDDRSSDDLLLHRRDVPAVAGSALMGGKVTQTLNRVTFDDKGGATPRRRTRLAG
jgi:hypothetical protein